MNKKINSKRSKRALKKCHRIIDKTYCNIGEEWKLSRLLKKYISYACEQRKRFSAVNSVNINGESFEVTDFRINL